MAQPEQVADLMDRNIEQQDSLSRWVLRPQFVFIEMQVARVWAPTRRRKKGVREGVAGKLYLAYLRDPAGNKICALHRMA